MFKTFATEIEFLRSWDLTEDSLRPSKEGLADLLVLKISFDPHQLLEGWPQLVPAWDEEALLVSMGPTKLPVEKASSRRVCINGGRPGWPTTFIYTQCAFLLCAFIQCVFLQCDQPPWCASTMCFLQCVFQKKKKITFLASPLQCISGMFEVFNKHLEILWYFSIQYRGGRSKW